MNILLGSFTLGMFICLIPLLNSQANKVSCLWESFNRKHQDQIRKRVDRYFLQGKALLRNCDNEDGFITLPGLLFLLLGLTLVWCLMAKMLVARNQILSREQILACTAVLEQQTKKFDEEMMRLNQMIYQIRSAELVAQAIPSQQTTAQAARMTRLTLQAKQQLLTLRFGTTVQLPFESCQSMPPVGLILFEHSALMLKRDLHWCTAKKKWKGKNYIWQKNLRMELVATRKMETPHFGRHLREINQVM